MMKLRNAFKAVMLFLVVLDGVTFPKRSLDVVEWSIGLTTVG